LVEGVAVKVFLDNSQVEQLTEPSTVGYFLCLNCLQCRCYVYLGTCSSTIDQSNADFTHFARTCLNSYLS